MASHLIEANRKDAEIVHGDELGQKKCAQMLKELDVPNGLLPLKDILEVGVNRKTGFVWVTQKKPTTHLFRKAGQLVQYGTEVTCFCAKHRAKKVTGVKAKEMFFWVALGDIYVDEKDSSKITFKNPMTGFTRTHPLSAFEREEEEEKKKFEDTVERNGFPLLALEGCVDL
ncbi:hypothetical protein ACHQM5_010799 [Ranunculus cassubicifolius]